MVLIRTPELKDIPSLQKLFLQLGYQTDVERLENHINQKHTSLSRNRYRKEASHCL